jgi:uncharacterized protein YbaA (DUF1428 family)
MTYVDGMVASYRKPRVHAEEAANVFTQNDAFKVVEC